MGDARATRRDFLKLGATSLGALGLGALLPAPVAEAARRGGLLDARGDGVIPTLCEMCVWRCGVLARVRDGRVIKLEGNPEHPHSRGHLCARGQAGLMATYDPDRVLQPLIRVGPRGAGTFRKASWDEALDLTAKKMLEIRDRYGPEAMIFSSTHNLSQTQFENLLGAYGSPNYGTQRSLCFNSMVTAFLLTYGIEEPARNYDSVEYILLVGRNLTEAISNSETKDLIEAVARGARLVYLDPRFTKTAAKATEWIPIRPGTDSAFVLAMIHVIVNEHIGDCDFARRYIQGCDDLPLAMAEYTPEWAESKTGVAAETIRRIAREFAAAKRRALAHPGWRTSNFVNSFQTERALATLNAVVGNIFEPNGCLSTESAGAAAVLGKPPQPAYPRLGAQRLDGVPWKYPMVPLKLGVFQELREAILAGQPYQAYGWFVSRQNPVLSLPDRRRTLEALNRLDFIVDVDVVLNDTAWLADVVLPEASYLERYDPLAVIGNQAFLRQPVIEAQGEARSALWIYKELGTRLGLADFFQYEHEEDYLRQQLAPLGVSLNHMRAGGKLDLPPAAKDSRIRFNTPSGKIEVYSHALAKAGFSPWPTWEEPPAPAPGQFYLLTGKVGQHTQFATQNNQYLHKYQDEPCVWMNADVAAAKGLIDGELVAVTSPVGRVRTRLLATQAIRPDCVYMAPGFGHFSKGLRTAYGVGASDSDLHVTYVDPISGGQALSQTFVTVERA